MVRIGVFGDSIAWGYEDLSKGGWVEQVRKDFLKTYDDVSVYNCSVSGDTTTELVRRFRTEYDARKPEYVIFAIGVNDSSFFNKDCTKNHTAPRQFEANLNKLYNQGKKKSQIIFLSITPVDESKTTPVPWRKELSYTNAMIAQYNKIIATFCKKKKIPFIAVNQLTRKDLADGLHPNTQGHKKIYLAVKGFILKNYGKALQ